MQAADAELLYIKEVEKLDGFGQESFAAKVRRRHVCVSGTRFFVLFCFLHTCDHVRL